LIPFACHLDLTSTHGPTDSTDPCTSALAHAARQLTLDQRKSAQQYQEMQPWSTQASKTLGKISFNTSNHQTQLAASTVGASNIQSTK